MKEKGIEDAIEAVKILNSDSIKYELDIYGQIDNNQLEWFNKIRENFPTYIHYKGLVPFDRTTDVLKEYYLLLFPTYYEGEGFPGTLIDALAAGLPVVASNWKYNKEIIDDTVGWIVSAKNKNDLANQVAGINNICKMKVALLNKAAGYLPNNAMSILLKRIERDS